MTPPTGDHRAKIDGIELEQMAFRVLRNEGQGLDKFEVAHREIFESSEGRFEIDVTARFRALGVDFLVLIECKDHVRPVGRDVVQVLADKRRALGAQKGILVSTNGFQSGAIEYAKQHRVALVRVIEGEFLYETRSAYTPGQRPAPPSWLNLPRFVGQHIRREGDGIHVNVIEMGKPGSLAEYLRGAPDPSEPPT